MSKKMIIAIDGPAGAGKGTLSRALSSRFHFAFLDTGLLFRAVSLSLLEKGLSFEDEALAVQEAASLSFDSLKNRRLREESVGEGASIISTFPSVREVLLKFSRQFAYHPPDPYLGAVLDGRDIGTVMCPDADVKFFVTASLEERAKRRYEELKNRSINCIYSQVLKEMRLRDERDTTRDVAPLVPAVDAYVLDTTSLSINDVVERAIVIIARHLPQTAAANLCEAEKD